MLAACLTVLLTVSSWLWVWFEGRRNLPMTQNADSLPLCRPELWPGFRSSCGLIAAFAMLLVVYHLSVPVRSNGGSFATGALAISGVSLMAAYATLSLGIHARSSSFIGAGLGSAALGLGGLMTTVLPSEPTTLGARYPMVFSALLSGFALAAFLMIGLWKRLKARAEVDAVSDDSLYFRRPLRRTLFLTLSLGLILASLSACWPRFPSVSAMDDSLGRVLGGTAANLFFMLASLAAARELSGPTFRVLPILCFLVSAGFLVVRLLPFAPQYG
jgi:hypothetical protein